MRIKESGGDNSIKGNVAKLKNKNKRSVANSWGQSGYFKGTVSI